MPYFTQEENILAAAYMRLSREDSKLGESNSITNQRMMLTDYITSHEMTLVDEFVDDGYTGTNFARPGFKALMDACEQGNVNCILVKDLSRLGRNATEVGRYITEIFPRMGIRFIAINDNYDSNDTEFAILDMTTPFKNLMNELYSKDLSRKIRATYDIARQNGDYMGGHPPYGYLRDPADKHHLIVDPECAPVIRHIFDMKISGLSNSVIADTLNMMNVESPKHHMVRLYGLNYTEDEESGVWLSSSITRILANELYTGTMVSAKRGRPNYKIRKLKGNAKEMWCRVENKHEPIVSREIFNYAQDVCSRSQASTITGEVRPLTGFLRCPDCGMLMIHQGSPNSANEYINCSSYVRKEGCCSHNLNLKRIESAVLGAIRVQIEYLVRARDRLKAEGVTSYRGDTIQKLDAEIEKVLKEEKRFMNLKTHLYEDKVNGIVSADEYKELDRHFTESLTAVEGRIAQLQAERERVSTEQMNIIPWIESIMQFRGLEKLSRRAVIMMVDYVYIHKNKTVDVHFRYQDEIRDLMTATIQRVEVTA